MLNKNANCYNIEKYFKYSTVVNTFSEDITIFRTLSIYIWQLKCQERQTNKTKNCKLFSANFSESLNFSSLSFLSYRSCYILVRPFPVLSCFSFLQKKFWKLIFATKIKTMSLKQSAVSFISCQKILRILYVWTLEILYTNKRILT